jgi:transposase
MARGVSADATVDAQEVFRENDRRPVLDGACVFGAKRPAPRHGPDSRTIRSTPGSGARAGFDGAKKRKGSKVHIAVDTLGHLLALHVTPAHEQDRGQVGKLAEAVQALTGESVEISFADQGDTGDKAEQAAAAFGTRRRALGSDAGWISLSRLCMPHALQMYRSMPKFITGSKPVVSTAASTFALLGDALRMETPF